MPVIAPDGTLSFIKHYNVLVRWLMWGRTETFMEEIIYVLDTGPHLPTNFLEALAFFPITPTPKVFVMCKSFPQQPLPH